VTPRHPLLSLGTAGIALGFVLLTAACGSTVSLSATAAPVLQKDAAALAVAARAGDQARFLSALALLRSDVSRERAGGQLSAARANRILDASIRVAADVTPAPATATPTTATTPTPTATATTPPATTAPPSASSPAQTTPAQPQSTQDTSGGGGNGQRGPRHGKGKGKGPGGH
jgi:hypothetical protein